jgi:hypothetical protein
MGGTEIHQPLQAVFAEVPDYPRAIFLLTDGGVSNPGSVIDLIKDNINNSRVHSFGIGSGASRELIINSAKAGKGVHEFVHEGERMHEKVISVLKKAILPALSKWTVEWESAVEGTRFSPSVKFVPNLYYGEVFTLYAHLGAQEFASNSLKLTCLNTKTNSPQTFIIPVDGAKAVIGDSVHKLWCKTRINELEHLRKQGADHKAEILELSLEYQIPSKETAFIASEKSDDPVTGEAVLRKIPISE